MSSSQLLLFVSQPSFSPNSPSSPQNSVSSLSLSSETVLLKQYSTRFLQKHGFAMAPPAECTKIARFSEVAAAIFTAPPQNRAIFKAPRCAISSAKKIASERRFSLRLKGTNLILTAEFPAIPESALKIASERRCAILVHSEWRRPVTEVLKMEISGSALGSRVLWETEMARFAQIDSQIRANR